MDLNYKDAIPRNIIWAMHQSGTKKQDLALELGCTVKTLAVRLRDAEFTFGQLVTISNVTGAPLTEIIKDAA